MSTTNSCRRPRPPTHRRLRPADGGATSGPRSRLRGGTRVGGHPPEPSFGALGASASPPTHALALQPPSLRPSTTGRRPDSAVFSFSERLTPADGRDALDSRRRGKKRPSVRTATRSVRFSSAQSGSVRSGPAQMSNTSRPVRSSRWWVSGVSPRWMTTSNVPETRAPEQWPPSVSKSRVPTWMCV